MLHGLKQAARNALPESLIEAYHLALAHLAAFVYGYPSKKLIVIGVTGTNGKTTTSYYLAKVLEAAGDASGLTTTAVLKVGDEEWLNATKMTMPGRFWLQRMLRRMVREGCKYAVIETSSQGLIQHRHVGIRYDAAVFTNLTPEHIEAHGGFENYKKAKRILFEHVASQAPKKIDGKAVKPFFVLNADDHAAEYYAEAAHLADVLWYGIDSDKGLRAERLKLGDRGVRFSAGGAEVCLNQPGEFNVYNALAALSAAMRLGVPPEKAAASLGEIARVPGRVERVEAGQDWTVIVDYAPEPESFKQLYEALSFVPRKKTIHVLGSCGGGRDVGRRAVLGRLAAEKADIVIVTNEDPYDDDPQEIVDQVAGGALEGGKTKDLNLFTILDRKEAIRKAMSLAAPGDLVVLTGKGCEPWICVAGGKKLPWDEVEAAKEAIRYVSQ